MGGKYRPCPLVTVTASSARAKEARKLQESAGPGAWMDSARSDRSFGYPADSNASLPCALSRTQPLASAAHSSEAVRESTSGDIGLWAMPGAQALAKKAVKAAHAAEAHKEYRETHNRKFLTSGANGWWGGEEAPEATVHATGTQEAREPTVKRLTKTVRTARLRDYHGMSRSVDAVFPSSSTSDLVAAVGTRVREATSGGRAGAGLTGAQDAVFQQEMASEKIGYVRSLHDLRVSTARR